MCMPMLKWSPRLFIRISISRIRNSGLGDYFRPPIESIRDELASVPVTFGDRSFSKSMRRDGETTERFLDTRGRCQASFTHCLLTGSRIEIPITRMIDAVLHEQKIVDDSATVSNIDVSFTSSNAMGGSLTGVDTVGNVLGGSFFKGTHTGDKDGISSRTVCLI